MVPFHPKASWDEPKTFAAGVAAAMTKASPALHTETIAKRAKDRPDLRRLPAQWARCEGRGSLFDKSSGRCLSVNPDSVGQTPSIRSGNQYRIGNLAARLPNPISDPCADFDTVNQAIPVSKRRRS